MDLTKMSLSELRDLDAKIAAQITRGESIRCKAAIEQIYAVAHGLGMPLQSILRGGAEARVVQRRSGSRRDAGSASGLGPDGSTLARTFFSDDKQVGKAAELRPSSMPTPVLDWRDHP